MNPVKLLIADDHKLFRDGLIALLGKHDAFEVLADFADGEELLAYLEDETQQADVLLLDIRMPGKNGFEVLQFLKNRKKPKVIAISMHDEGAYISRCAKLGAYGYLLKNTDEEELIEAIEEVAEGRKYFNTEISGKMVDAIMADEEVKSLTPKETEVLKYLAQGLINKEIADVMKVSTRTVETHRSNMIRKLEVKNTAELIRKAADLNLI